MYNYSIEEKKSNDQNDLHKIIERLYMLSLFMPPYYTSVY